MTKTKLIEVFQFYADYFAERKVKVEELTATAYNAVNIPSGIVLRHLAWMCQQAKTVLLATPIYSDDPDVSDDMYEKNVQKAHRWLGYIQGELRAMGRFSIAELREHSRTKVPPAPPVEAVQETS